MSWIKPRWQSKTTFLLAKNLTEIEHCQKSCKGIQNNNDNQENNKTKCIEKTFRKFKKCVEKFKTRHIHCPNNFQKQYKYKHYINALFKGEQGNKSKNYSKYSCFNSLQSQK